MEETFGYSLGQHPALLQAGLTSKLDMGYSLKYLLQFAKTLTAAHFNFLLLDTQCYLNAKWYFVLYSVSICKKKNIYIYITTLLALYQFVTAAWLWFVVHPEAHLSAALVLKGFLVNPRVDQELAIQDRVTCSHPGLPLPTKGNCLTEGGGEEAGPCDACGGAEGAGFVSLGKRKLGGGNRTAVFLYLRE